MEIWIAIAIGVATLVLLVVLLLRKAPSTDGARAELMAANERLERELRREISDSARGLRTELTGTLTAFQEAIGKQAGEATRTQNAQIDQLAQQFTLLQKSLTDTLIGQLQSLSEANVKRLAEVRLTLETQLATL